MDLKEYLITNIEDIAGRLIKIEAVEQFLLWYQQHGKPHEKELQEIGEEDVGTLDF